MIKYSKYILIVVSLILFVAAFWIFNEDRGLASFILAISSSIFAFAGIFAKPASETRKQNRSDKKRTFAEHLTNPDELLQKILQSILAFAVLFMFVGFFETAPFSGKLYQLLAHNAGTLYAKIVSNTIAGAFLGTVFGLSLLLSCAFTFGGIFLGAYAFGVKNKWQPIIYGVISGIISVSVFFIILGKMGLPSSEIWLQWLIIIASAISSGWLVWTIADRIVLLWQSLARK